MEKNQFKLDPKKDNIVELTSDKPLDDGVNKWGKWFLYVGNKDDIEHTFFVNSESLHKKLSEYSKGALVNIKQEEYAPNKFAWEVHALQGTLKKKKGKKTLDSSPISDARTLDIHKQVCLKLAVQSIDEFDIKVIEERTYQLLDVLHGSRPNKTLEAIQDVFDGEIQEDDSAF